MSSSIYESCSRPVTYAGLLSIISPRLVRRAVQYSTGQVHTMATVLLLFITLLTGSWFLKGLLSRSETRSLPLKTGAGIDPQRSYLLPGRMSHVRLRPKVHRFTYSYLMVGIAVRNQSSNWLLSIGKKNWWQRGWLQVLAADHLGRGNDSREIEHKVDSYIAEQVSDIYMPRGW